MKDSERDAIKGAICLLNAAERDLNWNHVVSASVTLNHILEGEFDYGEEIQK